MVDIWSHVCWIGRCNSYDCRSFHCWKLPVTGASYWWNARTCELTLNFLLLISTAQQSCCLQWCVEKFAFCSWWVSSAVGVLPWYSTTYMCFTAFLLVLMVTFFSTYKTHSDMQLKVWIECVVHYFKIIQLMHPLLQTIDEKMATPSLPLSGCFVAHTSVPTKCTILKNL